MLMPVMTWTLRKFTHLRNTRQILVFSQSAKRLHSSLSWRKPVLAESHHALAKTGERRHYSALARVLAVMKTFFETYALSIWVRPVWLSIPARERHLYKRYFRRIAVVSCACLAVYVWYHIEKTPITGRLRYIPRSDVYIKAACSRWQLNRSTPTVAKTEELYKYTDWVLRRLLMCNEDLLNKIRKVDWKLILIDDQVNNASALWDGRIHVHRGMLTNTENEESLAFVIAHEIAHIILGHAKERNGSLSFMLVFSMALEIGTTFLPNSLVSLLVNFASTFIELYSMIPYDLQHEYEADKVGMLLAARFGLQTGYDPTEMLYMRMFSIREDFRHTITTYESGHPLWADRKEALIKELPKMMAVYRETECKKFSMFNKAPPQKGRLEQAQLEYYDYSNYPI